MLINYGLDLKLTKDRNQQSGVSLAEIRSNAGLRSSPSSNLIVLNVRRVLTEPWWCAVSIGGGIHGVFEVCSLSTALMDRSICLPAEVLSRRLPFRIHLTA